MKSLITFLSTVLISMSIAAQDSELENMPGYVDLSTLDAIYGEPRVMINIGGPLMTLLSAAAASSDDPQAAALMKDLQGVRVNIYDTVGNIEPALEQMEQAKATLQASAWQPIVQVKEEGENVQMFTRVENDKMQGMAIMVVNAEEAVFLNILGTIDPADVGKVMTHLNVDVDPGTVKE
jgi:ribosomal protein L12E/L44/L45/RPP1/RPP2